MNHEEPSEMELFLANLSYTDPKDRKGKIESSQWKSDLEFHEDTNKEHFASVTHTSSNTLYNLHRGTASKDDVLTDVQLGLNNLHNTVRFKSSDRMSTMSQYKYGKGKTIIEVGHSLGGALAEEIGQKYNRKSIALNMGTTPLKDYSKVDRVKHRHHRTSGDPISSFDPYATHRTSTHKKPAVSVHEKLWGKRSVAGSHWNKLKESMQSHTLASFS